MTFNGLELRIQNVEQKRGARRLVKPTVEPAVPEHRVGGDGPGHPRTRWFENIVFHPGVVDVPTVLFNEGVGEEGEAQFERLTGEVRQVVGLQVVATGR